MADLMGLMKQAREMQQKMTEAQEKLDREEVTGESGAGLVTVTMTAKGEIKSVKLDPSMMVPSEVEVVEDLIVAASAKQKTTGTLTPIRDLNKRWVEIGAQAQEIGVTPFVAGTPQCHAGRCAGGSAGDPGDVWRDVERRRTSRAERRRSRTRWVVWTRRTVCTDH